MNDDNNNNNNNNDKNNNLVKKSKKMILVDEKDPVGELPPPFPPRNFQVKEDDDMRDFFDIKKEIGRGRFGTVYLVEDKKTRQKFAAKFVNTKRNQDRANVEREVEIMKTLNSEMPHPRLIQLYDAYDMEKEMCLVLEIVDGGELFERVINDDFVLTERACTVFVKQICEGVEFIHSKNILHLDMKPENILCLSREGNRVKICDFGLARRYDPRKKLQVLFGTPEFVAPEVVNFEPIGFGTDMWSVGVICYVLLSGLSPFMGHNYVETMTNVTHNKYDFDDEAFDSVSEDAKEFIQKLLVLDKSLRLTPAQCLRHTWLRTPPPPKFHPLQRRFPSSASTSEDETSEEEEEEDEEESEEDSEEESEEEKIVIKVEEKIRKEEETEKYSVRRRRKKEEEETLKKKMEEEGEEERKKKELEAKRKDLERQIEEKKRRIAEEEERCKRIKEEEEAKQREEQETRRRKREEEEERRRQEEEARRKREEEKARRRKKEEEEAERRRKEEEDRRRAEQEKRRKEEEEKKRKEAEEKRRREAEEKRRKEVEEKKRKEAEKKKREADEKERREAEERRKKEEEEEKRKEAEKREMEKRKMAEERKRKEMEEKKKKEEEERKRKEAEERKKKVAEEKTKERKDKRRGSGRGEKEGELERSKAQLREFVARWNAHPNSPYVMVSGDVPTGFEATRVTSGASLTSLAVIPPSDLNSDLDDEDEAGAAAEDEEFVHYTITAPVKGPASPPQVAKHLEARLKQLQREEGKDSGKDSGKSRGRGRSKGSSRSERRRSSSKSRVLKESEEAESIIQQILNVDHRSAYEEYQRMVMSAGGSGQLRHPEIVALQQEEGSGKRTSRNASPSRQPRRQPSRDVPRDDRPPSKDRDRSPAPIHRRPSRDVPLNPAQMDRLAKLAGKGEAWPDLIVAPQGEADEEVRQFSLDVPVASLLKSPSGTLRSVPGLKVSAEPEGDATPAHTPTPSPSSSPRPVHKGAPSLTPPPSPPSENCTKPALSPTHNTGLAPTPSPTPSSTKAALTPPPSPTPSRKGSEDGPGRLVDWIMDLGTRTPPRQNSAASLQDRVNHWEARDASPRPAPSPAPSPRLSPSPRPSPSPSTSPSRRPQERAPRPPQGGGNVPRLPQPPFLTDTTTSEAVIQTPWGALKRSPSRTSLSKSPSRERNASPARPAPGVSSPHQPPPARPHDGPVGWAAGGKSHTLPRSAKLMRQKSVGSVPGGGDAPQPEADGSLKRKSKFAPSPNKRPLAPLLFSAQDRISMFEKQQPATRAPPKPLARTRSSVTLGGNAPIDPRAGDRSQVGFMKTRLLGKVGRGLGPTLAEEPTATTTDTGRRQGPDAA